MWSMVKLVAKGLFSVVNALPCAAGYSVSAAGLPGSRAVMWALTGLDWVVPLLPSLAVIAVCVPLLIVRLARITWSVDPWDYL